MELKDGKWYKTGRGTLQKVMGPARDHPEFVYTLQGDWFRRSDGRYITYIKDYDEKNRCIGGHHQPTTVPTGLDLVEESERND